MFTTTLLLTLPAFIAAQIYGPPPVATTSASSAPASAPSAPPDTPGNMNIDVFFQGNYVFNPSNITAPNGTLVTFFFPVQQLEHSVTQSSFADPCTYLAANGSTEGGFDSGLQSGTQFTINITDDTQPIWFHCKQVEHCGTLGMVGSINAPTSGDNTFAAFQSAALALGSNAPTETDNGPVTGGVNAVATATPAATVSVSAGASGSSGSSGSSLGTNDAVKTVAGFSIIMLSTALAMLLA